MKGNAMLGVISIVGLVFGGSVMESSLDDVGLILGLAISLVSLAGLYIAIRRIDA